MGVCRGVVGRVRRRKQSIVRAAFLAKVEGMAIIEGIRIQNYRVLRNITLGRVSGSSGAAPLTPMTAVIGKNGVGKSSLFDAFGFLADCLKLGVEEACDERGRGGFDRIRSQGSDGSIEFLVCYREEVASRLIVYSLVIGKDESGRPSVIVELLSQQSCGQTDELPRAFLILSNGAGAVWKGDAQGQQIEESVNEGVDFKRLLARFNDREQPADEDDDVESVVLQDNRRLGIATLGALKQHPRIAAFREFLEGWYLSYFTPDAARGLPLAGPQRRLSIHGDNLANVVQYMQRERPDEFDGILRKIAGRVPGIDRIDAQRSEDGRLLAPLQRPRLRRSLSTLSRCPTER